MWMGELVTERGIGNGMSLLIFASSLIYIPQLITQLVRSGRAGSGNSWWDKFVGTYLSDPSNVVYIVI